MEEYDLLKKKHKGNVPGAVLDARLNAIAKQKFHNHSPFTFDKLKGAPDSIAQDLISYINGFSHNVREIFTFFEFEKEVALMNETNILYLVVSKFAAVDLHPDRVPNIQMGQIFENLIRRFNELANETAGDHFTPREIIKLMVNILFMDDDALLSKRGTIRTMLDPTCGTGGMLAEAQAYIKRHHAQAKLYTYGQDYNKRAFATAASDMLIKEVFENEASEDIKYGDTLTDDQFEEQSFDYLIANPPFGVDWKKQKSEIDRDKTGRFSAGLPRVNDGALLFLQHMISKFEPYEPEKKHDGSRLAIVFSGSPMFSGGAGSGESDIRKWIIENDWLEAIIALPEQMFYNTGIGTYIWVLTNRKAEERKGKIQLFDAREFYIPMRKSMGSKRRKIGEGEVDDGIINVIEPHQINEIVKEYGRFKDAGHSKTFDNADFGYTRVTVERPLRLTYQTSPDRKEAFLKTYPQLREDIQRIDKQLGREPNDDWNEVEKQIAVILKKKNSNWKQSEWKLFRSVFTFRNPAAEKVKKNKDEFEADPELRDFENIPLKMNIGTYFKNEVLRFIPDAWMDRTKDKIGYEINFNRYFFKPMQQRSLKDINKELNKVEKEILKLIENTAN